MSASTADTVVLGAGLQGLCVAFALREAGHRVTVVEREPACMRRASLYNEGKIHLGLVYANDRGGRTPELMLDAAFAFGPLMERWLDAPVPWTALSAAPFKYLILRDTLVPAAELYGAWQCLEASYQRRKAAAAGSMSYLGTVPDRLWRPADESAPWRAQLGSRVTDAIDTAERALDVVAFRAQVEARLARANAPKCLFGHTVTRVARVGRGFRVSGHTVDGAPWALEAETVVNCLWEGRLAIDQQLGLLPKRPWVHRLKCRMLGQLPPRFAGLPSFTLVCGRFGDVVNYGDGRMYLSWYPACLRGWSTDVEVPAAWDRVARGVLDRTTTNQIVSESLEALDTIVPGLRESRIDSLGAGVIFSWGQSDIDDLDSELHRRDDIGPAADDGYVTVNTGKLTTAPLYAAQVAQILAGAPTPA